MGRRIRAWGWSGGKAIARSLMPLAVSALIASSPAHAQFSEGYKFLDAVRKRDGYKVEEALGEPGSTIINARDVSNGEGALHIVVARRDLTWTRYLIQKGANVNMRDNRGATPLQLAANLGFLDGIEALVDAKADVNQANDAGETPLITAIHRRNVPMMRILLKAGADPDRADNSGRTARDYAQLDGRGNPLLAEIETNAKAKGQRAGAKPVYGPSF